MLFADEFNNTNEEAGSERRRVQRLHTICENIVSIIEVAAAAVRREQLMATFDEKTLHNGGRQGGFCSSMHIFMML